MSMMLALKRMSYKRRLRKVYAMFIERECTPDYIAESLGIKAHVIHAMVNNAVLPERGDAIHLSMPDGPDMPHVWVLREEDVWFVVNVRECKTQVLLLSQDEVHTLYGALRLAVGRASQ